jgi:hypothetical protein
VPPTLSLFETLREHPPHIPIVIFTEARGVLDELMAVAKFMRLEAAVEMVCPLLLRVRGLTIPCR